MFSVVFARHQLEYWPLQGRRRQDGERRTTFLADYDFRCVPFSRFGSFYILLWIYSICQNLLMQLSIRLVACVINRPNWPRCESIGKIIMTPDYFHNLIWSYRHAVDVIILMDRVERKPDVAACEHHKHRPAYTSAQSDQRFYCWLPGKYNW